jgi:hypothetical protein
MGKKVTIATKPTTRRPASTPDEWVAGVAPVESAASPEAKPKEALTRFTIDIPTGLHRRIKSQCANRGVKMRDDILALLLKHYPE